MNRVLTYLFRFAVIIGGYLVASLAASTFLNVLMLGALGFIGGETSPAVESLVFSVPFVALFVAYFAFIPSVFAILISEILAKRDWLFHAMAGAVVSLVIVGFMRGATETGNEVVTGSGMCGGIGYWLIAGRTAGLWRQAREDVTSPAR